VATGVIANVILELSILDIQTMSPSMVKTHLGQVKNTGPQQHPQMITTMGRICNALPSNLVTLMKTGGATMTKVRATETIIATAEAEQQMI